MTTNIRAVGDALAVQGVDTVFGLVGNGNLDLVVDVIDRKGLRYLAFRHECGAVAAADGYSRAGDRLGIATVTHGPGFANALTALVTARRARSRLLLIAGNAGGYTGRSTQKLDQAAVARAAGVPVVMPGPSEDWGAATNEALRRAQDGAVLLDLPAEAMRQAARRGGWPESESAALAMPDRAALDLARSWLRQAERPILLAGRGALRAGLRDQFVDLAERHGARLGTSLAAKGLFTGETGDIGLVGGLGSPLSLAACRECDLLLAVGASLNGFTTEHATLFKAARVVRIDSDADAPASIPVDLTLTGDAVAIVAALAADTGTARPLWVHANDAAPRPAANNWPLPVLAHLDTLLPRDRAVVFDHGDQSNWAVPHFTAHDATQSLFMPDFGSLGLSLPAAIGAAAARPDRRTLAVVGDGGLMMSLPELDTLRRTGLPVTVVVLNDGVYGAEYPHLKAMGASLTAATFDSAPIADLAGAMGLRAYRIREADDLGNLAEAVSGQGPSLVEVVCLAPSGLGH